MCVDGAKLVTLQKNRYWRTPEDLSLNAGSVVAALEYASGEQAIVIGKPEAGFIWGVLEDRGLQARGVAMVRDDAQAEVAGANRAGLLSIQVRTGTWRPDSEEWDADLVPDTIAVLPEALNIRRG